MCYRPHTFSHDDLWPSDISAIVQELASSAARSSSLSKTVDAFGRLVEDRKSGYTDHEKKNLRLLPDALIRFSHLLREIQRRRACGEEHCTLTFTYHLIKIVGLCIDERASVTSVGLDILDILCRIAWDLMTSHTVGRWHLFVRGALRGPRELRPPSCHAS